MSLAQQLLSPGVGTNLLAAIAAATAGGAIGDHSVAAPPAEIPGTGDTALHLPHPIAMAAGPVFGIEVLLGITAAEVLPVGNGLAVLHQRQVDVDVAGHLRHRAAVAIGGEGLDADLAAPR